MPLPSLSLDCLTLTDSSPIELIESAYCAGFDLVSLWVHSASYPRQLVSPAIAGDCAEMLTRLGVAVHSLDAVDLASLDAVRSARPAMELGARLGGKAILAYHYSNPDRAEVADSLALLAELAGEFGLGVNLEPIVFGPTATVADANALIEAADVDVGILFDTYHFIRSGGTPRDLLDFDCSRIRYVQINDGPLFRPEEEWYVEATEERLLPGQGQFPLKEILTLLPQNVPWGIEVPQLGRMRDGVTREMLATEAMHALRTAVEQVLG